MPRQPIKLTLLLSTLAISAGLNSNAATNLPPINPAARSQFAAVLMWHDVVNGPKQVWFDTTVQELTAQFEHLRKLHCHIITLDTLYKHLSRGTPLPPRPVLLTFDDNYSGLYTNAFPLLKRFGYPATFFAHTDFVGVSTIKEHCTWDQLKEMEASGLVVEEAQTCSHPADLRLISDDQIRKEFLVSRASIVKHLGGSVIAMTYPEGHYNRHVAEMAAHCGYKIAFAEDRGDASTSDNLLMVHRYTMHRRPDQPFHDIVAAYP